MTELEQKQLMEIAAALSSISTQLIEFCGAADIQRPNPQGDLQDPKVLAERIQGGLPQDSKVTDEQ